MNVLIKSARIIQGNGIENDKKSDILIEKGIITEIRHSIKTDSKVKIIEGNNLCVSPGWLDMQTNFRDPGFEHKEDIVSGANAAASGGFTAVCLMPSTNPVVHTKSQVEYIKGKAATLPVDIYPVGALSVNQEGKDLSELFDMQLSGALAFSDDKNAIKDSGFLMRALQYSSNIDALIITHCSDSSIAGDGLANEGVYAIRLGLKGIPALAEELMIQRNISILEYTGGRIHIPLVTTKHGLELIKHAKNKGLRVTAGVAAHYLFLDESKLAEFDSNYKLNPPLRSREDVEALKKGLASGIIDVVVSDHSPEDRESKEVEFDYASCGIIGLETAFSVFNTACGNKLSIDSIVQKLSVQPRKILGLTVPELKTGEKANLSIFDPEQSYEFNKSHVRSKSANTPFIGETFKGKVIGIYNKQQLVLA